MAVCTACLCTASTTVAEVSLPSVYTDNMVLQRNATVNLPGHATPGAQVILKADWLTKPRTATADRDGNFTLTFTTPDAGGPYTLTLNDGGNDRTLRNVLVGEVWLCSGQSNMEFPVRGSWARLADADRVVADMHRPALRLLQVKNTTAMSPQTNAQLEYGWVESSPAAESFSAIGYLYGRALQDSLNVPVGIIDATWGGTPVESWTPRAGLQGVDGLDFYYHLLGKEADADRLTRESMQKVYNDYQSSDKIPYPFDLGKLQSGRGWHSMQAPGYWEAGALPDFDGIVMMQYELTLPEAAAGKPLHLHLGNIDDWDKTYFNGQFVGTTQMHDQQRDYAVDGSLVRAGSNVITVEVVDLGGFGGMYLPMYAEVDGRRYSLDGQWRYGIVGDFAQCSTPFRMPLTPHYPTALYNAMISPLTSMPLAGVLWYQGCSNVGRAAQYEQCFKNMINQWRSEFGQPQLPFYFVLLAGYQAPVLIQPESEWALLRQAQSRALELPNTGMACAVDLGNPVDIHPTNKQEVARRLLLLSLNNNYGRPQTCKAPAPVGWTAKGNVASVDFDGPLTAVGGVVTGVIVRDGAGAWHYANARLESDCRLVVKAPEANRITELRYNWADYPDGNLYGPNKLPVTPFSINKELGIRN